jgi:hypothetical protein
MMAVLDKVKSFFKRSKPQAKAEEAKPAAKGAEGEAAKAPESKTGEQKGAGGA